jgi:DnaJ-class molecular chaperone
VQKVYNICFSLLRVYAQPFLKERFFMARCRICNDTRWKHCVGTIGDGECSTCKGKGEVRLEESYTECHDCHGTGDCQTCDGTGEVDDDDD